MPTVLQFIALAFLATSLSALAESGARDRQSHERHRTIIEFYPNIGPTRVHNGDTGEDLIKSPSYDLYAENAITAMLDGEGHRGGSLRVTPTAFNKRHNNRVSPGEIIATEFNTWRGDLDPDGAFTAEAGTFWRLGVRISSKRPFTLGEVRKLYSDSLDADEFTLAESIVSFAANRAVGINWGANGRPGGGDDVIYDSDLHDAATTPLNVFAWLGNGKLDFITIDFLHEFFGGDEQAFFADWLLFLSGDYPGGPNFEAPLFFKYTYEVGLPGAVRARASYTTYVCDPPHRHWRRQKQNREQQLTIADNSTPRGTRPRKCARK